MNNLQITFIAEYLLATQNEIAVDANVYALSGIEPAEFGYAPRPSKLFRFSNRRKILSAAISFIRGVWRFGGAYLFVFSNWLLLSYGLRNVTAQKVEAGQDFALAFSSRAADLITSEVVGVELSWITFPWVPTKLDSRKSYDYISFLDQKDLNLALKMSIIALKKLNSRPEMVKWSLQGYTAFRWFAVRVALEKVRAHRFYTAEHYDRWAMLADGVMRRRRRELKNAGCSSEGLVVLQHGMFFAAVDKNPPAMFFSLASKLRSVVRLFVYDEESRDIFKNSVVSFLSPLCWEQVSVYSSPISPVAMAGGKDVNVLIVGHPVCEVQHAKIYADVLSGYNLGCYYKGHPTNPGTDLVSALDWLIINDKDIFPLVDFVISYPSTLVGEYATVGIPAIVHPLNVTGDDYVSLTSSIKDKLESLACEKKLTQ